MYTNDIFPPAYIKAKIRMIDNKILQLPDVRLGHRKGRDIFRQYSYDNGKRKIREFSCDKPEGRELFDQSEARKTLIKEKNQLRMMIKGVANIPDVDVTRDKTIYNKSMWENIHIRAEFETKESGYHYKDMVMDSRAEMIVAQTLESLGLQYKYEPRIFINGELYYPDFIVYLPEFERCFFIEFLGQLDNEKYISRNKFKIMDYLKAGMVINRDILLFCGYEDSMVTADDMIDDILALIKKYCRIYSKPQD